MVIKGENGFLGVLREVSGTVQFDEKIATMQKELENANEKKLTLNNTLDEINKKL